MLRGAMYSDELPTVMNCSHRWHEAIRENLKTENGLPFLEQSWPLRQGWDVSLVLRDVRDWMVRSAWYIDMDGK